MARNETCSCCGDEIPKADVERCDSCSSTVCFACWDDRECCCRDGSDEIREELRVVSVSAVDREDTDIDENIFDGFEEER